MCAHILPLLELGVEDPVGKALPADPDAFQHAVTAQLVQHKKCIHDPCAEQVSNMSRDVKKSILFLISW